MTVPCPTKNLVTTHSSSVGTRPEYPAVPPLLPLHLCPGGVSIAATSRDVLLRRGDTPGLLALNGTYDPQGRFLLPAAYERVRAVLSAQAHTRLGSLSEAYRLLFSVVAGRVDYAVVDAYEYAVQVVPSGARQSQGPRLALRVTG
jgi:hypothetical protein